MVDIRRIFDLAAIVAKAHKEHTRLAVEVDQRKDSVGVAVLVRFRAPMPPGAVAVAGLKSGFGFQVGSRDGKLFRDSCGDFQTMSMVSEQVAGLYIPYGVTKHRKAGLYSLEIGVVLADPDGGDSLGHTDVKVALPRPRAWHKVDYLWPFISLCMAVVRADAEVKRGEIRPLKALLVEQFGLSADDMEGLRLAMRTRPPADHLALLRSTRQRMPYLRPRDLIALLLRVACYDGALNRREHTLVRRLAVHAGIDDRTWGMLVERNAR